VLALEERDCDVLRLSDRERLRLALEERDWLGLGLALEERDCDVLRLSDRDWLGLALEERDWLGLALEERD